MDQKVRAFLEDNHGAVMTTLKSDGTPHVARIGVGLVEGELWSSATDGRARTKYLRRDPRSTLCVLDADTPYRWLGLETRVDILDGPERVEQNLTLYRVLAGEPEDLEEYRRAMVEEGRLIYRFSISRAYGQF